MKPTGWANKPEPNLSSAIEGALTVSGLDLETKIFSASGRGRGFFLTSLFIELIDLQKGETKGKACANACFQQSKRLKITSAPALLEECPHMTAPALSCPLP